MNTDSRLQASMAAATGPSSSGQGNLLAGGAFLLLAVVHLLSSFLVTGLSPFGHILAGGDAYSFFHPSHHLYRDALLAGWFPFWTDLYYAGFPFASDPQSSAWFPPALPFLLLPASLGYHLKMAAGLAVACWGTWLVLRRMGVRVEGAWVGALTFAFGGTIMARLTNQPPMVFAAAFLPWMVLAARLRRRWPLVGLLVGGCLLAGHPQVSLYVLAAFFPAWAMSSIWTFVRANRHVRRREAAALRLALPIVMAAVAGGMLAGVQIFTGAELSAGSVRPVIDREFFFSYQFETSAAALFFFPFLFGHYKAANWPAFPYSGPWNLNEMAVNPGSQGGLALALVLAVVLVVPVLRRRAALPPSMRRHGVTWLIVAGIFLLLSLGNQTPLGGLLYHLPPFSLFRGQARLMIPVQFAVGILAGLGVHWWLGALVRREGRRLWLLLLPALVWLGGALVALVTWHLTGAGAGVFAELGVRERLSRLPRLVLRHSGIWLPLATCAAGAAALLVLGGGRQRARAAGLILVCWATAEALLNGFNYLPRPVSDPARMAIPAPFAEGGGRVAMAFPFADYFRHHNDLPLPLVSALHGISTLNGFSPLIPMDLNRRLSLSVVGAVDPPEGLLAEGPEALRALGVRWLVAPMWMMPEVELDQPLPEGARSGVLGGGWISGGEDGAAFEAAGTSARLDGAAGALSLGRIPAGIESNRWYRIAFHARRDGPAEGMPLHVDLYGEGYDLNALEMTVGDGFLSTEPREFSALWFTGEAPPKVELRLFTRSAAGITVEGLRLEEAGREARAGAYRHGGIRFGSLDLWELPPVAPVRLAAGGGEVRPAGHWVDRTPARKVLDLDGDAGDVPPQGAELWLTIRFDPGWRAWFDEGTHQVELETSRGPHQQLVVSLSTLSANAIPLDSGEIHLRYRPVRLSRGLFVSMLGLLAITAPGVVAILGRKRRLRGERKAA